MKDKNLKYIAHAKTAFLWLLLFVFLYQPWTEMCPGRKEDNEE